MIGRYCEPPSVVRIPFAIRKGKGCCSSCQKIEIPDIICRVEGLVVGGSKSLDKIPVLVGGNKNALDIVAAIVTVVASLQISRGGDTRTLENPVTTDNSG